MRPTSAISTLSLGITFLCSRQVAAQRAHPWQGGVGIGTVSAGGTYNGHASGSLLTELDRQLLAVGSVGLRARFVGGYVLDGDYTCTGLGAVCDFQQLSSYQSL